MSQTAVVLGASGLVGKAIVDQLVEAEHVQTIRTLTRRSVEHRSPKVSNHIINFEQLYDHPDLFTGDLFFSALGTTRKTAGSIAAQRVVDLDYQLEAAQIASKNGIEHYLLVSSSAADSSSKNAYLKMKGDLEDAVRALPFKRISIFRPSLLLGERNDFRAGEIVGSKILPIMCRLPGLRRYRPISGAEVAARMIEVGSSNGPSFQTYDLDEIFLE